MKSWKYNRGLAGLFALAMGVYGCGGSEDALDGGSLHGEGMSTGTVGSMEGSGESIGAAPLDPGGSYGGATSDEYGEYEEYNAPTVWGEGGDEGGGESAEGGEGFIEESLPPEEEEEAVPGDDDGATFVSTNPYVLVESQPTSTFASDSDTASYDMFRQQLSWGTLLSPEGVRLEEFVNAFEYDYPTPAEDAEDPFEINLALTESPFTEGASILRIGIQGERVDRTDFEGVNLVFLVDVSGSMGAANKMPLVKEMLTEAVHQLGPNDRISIVTYSGMEQVLIPATPVEDKGTILAAIDSLDTGGSTAGAAGLQMAYEQAEHGWIDGGVNHVVLCTDGDFNVGISNTQDLIEFIEEKRKTNVTLTAVGFGGGHNDEMMELVSNAGNGVYKLVTDMDDAIDYASDGLISSLFFIAKDVKIQLEFNMDSVFAYRKLGYENRELEDWMFFEKTIDAGEIPQSHAVTAIYELIPQGQSLPEPEGAPALMTDVVEPLGMEITPEEMVLVKVRYKQPGASEEDPSKQVTSSLSFDEAPIPFEEADVDTRFASAVAAFAEILKTSPYGRPDLSDDILEIVGDSTAGHQDRNQLRTQMEEAFAILNAQSAAFETEAE